jgi:hypothetical protein
MPIFEYTGIDGVLRQTFVCGRGSGGIKQCAFCNRVGGFQCDVFVVPKGIKPRRRCNRHMCEHHRTNLAPDKDACPDHAAIALAALERHKQLALAAAANTSTCPKCHAEQEDRDGFGVLHCQACGFCSHASVDGGICGLCGTRLPAEVSA